jgi:hypothetical protein
MTGLLKEGWLSACLREVPYVGQWPNIPEFKYPLEYAVQIGQGHAEISLQGKPLHSAGFGFCEGFIIQKEEGLEAYGAHIDEMRLSDNQLETIDSLPSGDYIGRFVRGSVSRDLRDIILNPRISLFMSTFSRGRNLTVLRDITVDTGEVCWEFVYKPTSRLLMVQVKLTNTVKEFDFTK